MIDLNTLVPGYDGTLIIAGGINDAGVITGFGGARGRRRCVLHGDTGREIALS